MNIYMTFQQSKRSASEQIEQVITGTSLKWDWSDRITITLENYQAADVANYSIRNYM